MKSDVISLANKKVGTIDLDPSIFGIDVRRDIMARMVNWQLAKRRAGTHKVKTRAEIRGTTAKPFNQKGTGRARQGSKKVPQLRGGGVAMGPVVRNHNSKLPKKIRSLALKSALSCKLAEGKLIVIDEAKLPKAKTSDLSKKLEKLAWGRVLVIDGAEVENNFLKASTNLYNIDVLPTVGANVYDILKRDTLVLTKEAVEKLVERLK